MVNALEVIDRLKEELDALRPLSPSVLAQIEQKLRLEWNYNSNAIEGNTLTLRETRSLILHGLTAHGKPFRDHIDIEGHDSAVQAIQAAVDDAHQLNQVFIRNLHRILLKEPYPTTAETPGGRLVQRTISVGDYKTTPNNVRTSTGETYYFTPPDQVAPAMSDLIDWYRTKESEGEHPIIIAATFHYRFVRIHPFDDGNGRMARLLMNLILIKHGYTVAIIRQDGREEYIDTLEQVDQTEDLTEFINYVARCCEYSLNLHLKAARGEPIDDIEDIDKEIALFKRSLTNAPEQAFSASELIDSVLLPFAEYCVAKTLLLSDLFGRVQTLITVFITTHEGEVVRVCEDSTSLAPLGDHSIRPKQSRSLSFSQQTYLTSFQGTPRHFLIQVENNTNVDRCRWTFSIGALSVRREHHGRDLEDLKRQFNQLLRGLMTTLGEANGDPQCGSR